jgi:hypothetical protein
MSKIIWNVELIELQPSHLLLSTRATSNLSFAVSI